MKLRFYKLRKIYITRKSKKVLLRGKWKLAPAYDMTFSYNPTSLWTSNHQIMINGKRNGITIEDMFICGKNMDISEKKIKQIVNQTIQVVNHWPQYAQKAELEEVYMEEIRKHHHYKSAEII